MSRKACVIETTVRNAPIIGIHLPAGVVVGGQLASADNEHVRMRLEGDGLPDWCYCAHGAYLIPAVAELLEDGTLRLIPGSGLPDVQVPERFFST